MHLAGPHISLCIHCELHQADVGRGKGIEMPLRDTHDRGDGGDRGKVHPHLSQGLSMSQRSSHSALTGTRGTTTAQEHEQRAKSDQRQHQAGRP